MSGMSSLTKLNDALLAELERLASIETTEGEKLEAEINRAKAVSGLANSITNNHKLALSVARERASYKVSDQIVIPKMLEG